MDSNSTENTTKDNDISSKYDATHAGIELVLVPVIAVFGMVGNAFSCAMFVTKPLNKNSSSLFLALRSVSDSGFLATLLIIWMSSIFDLRLSHTLPVCQLMIYLTYVFSCSSVWLVVLITLENYVRICKPFHVYKICKRNNAAIISVCMTAVILCCYCFPFWTVGTDCQPLEKHHDTIQTMVYVDSVMTMFAPIGIMVCALMAMFWSGKCKRSYLHRKKTATSSRTGANPVKQVTTMLFAVTIIFLILNLPSHTVRLRYMDLYVIDSVIISQNESVFQTASMMLHYMSLAINFVIYYTFGSRFRATVNAKVFKSFKAAQKTDIRAFAKKRNYRRNTNISDFTIVTANNVHLTSGSGIRSGKAVYV